MDPLISLFYYDKNLPFCFFSDEILLKIIEQLSIRSLLNFSEACKSSNKFIFNEKTIVRRIVCREITCLAQKIEDQRRKISLLQEIALGKISILQEIALADLREEKEDGDAMDIVVPEPKSPEELEKGYAEFKSDLLEKFEDNPKSDDFKSSLCLLSEVYRFKAQRDLAQAKKDAYMEGAFSPFSKMMRSVALLEILKIEINSDFEAAKKTLEDILVEESGREIAPPKSKRVCPVPQLPYSKGDTFNFKSLARQLFFQKELADLRKWSQAHPSQVPNTDECLELCRSISDQNIRDECYFELFCFLGVFDRKEAVKMAENFIGEMRKKMMIELIRLTAWNDIASAKKLANEKIAPEHLDQALLEISFVESKSNFEHAKLTMSSLKDEKLRDHGFARLSTSLPLNNARKLIIEKISLKGFRSIYRPLVIRECRENELLSQILSSARKIESAAFRVSALLAIYDVIFRESKLKVRRA